MDAGLIVAAVALGLTLIGMARQRRLREENGELSGKLNRLEAKLSEMTQTKEPSKDHALAPRLTDSKAAPEEDHLSMKALTSSVQVLGLRAQEHDALLCALVTEDEARHLWNIAQQQPMEYELLQSTQEELRSLVRRGFVKKRGDFKIHELPRRFELTDRFELSDAGTILLDLRKALQDSDLRPATSLPPPLLETEGPTQST